MAEKMNDLFDLSGLRRELMEYMVFSEKSTITVAHEIGIAFSTLQSFLLNNKKPIFKTTAKIINYVNEKSLERKKSQAVDIDASA